MLGLAWVAIGAVLVKLAWDPKSAARLEAMLSGTVTSTR